MENLTHWKKNNDPRYISGEDLKEGIAIGKGLAPEMVVMIDRFEDAETFDQNSQKKVVKTGFWLKTLDGRKLYKPVILNNTNAAFCIKEFGSSFMEHWIGKPMVLYALADKRHGFVARFKKYYPPASADPKQALESLSKVESIDDLKLVWEALSKEEKLLPTVMAKKEELKTKYTTNNAS
jgi:hypothetical protein